LILWSLWITGRIGPVDKLALEPCYFGQFLGEFCICNRIAWGGVVNLPDRFLGFRNLKLSVDVIFHEHVIENRVRRPDIADLSVAHRVSKYLRRS